MEKAINFKDINALKRIDLNIIDRFYFGEEFCERLLPSVNSLKKVIEKARCLNKRVSLLTPPSTERALGKVRLLINLLRVEDEVIINDYGILNMVNKEFKNPIVIGRILGRNILNNLVLAGKRQELIKEYLSLLSPKIKRIEVDYFNIDKVNIFLTKIVNFSFYKGPFFWALTRRCAFNMNSRTLDKFAYCDKECLKYKAVIRNKAVDKKFLLEGNKLIDLEKTNEKKINCSILSITYAYPPYEAG